MENIYAWTKKSLKIGEFVIFLEFFFKVRSGSGQTQPGSAMLLTTFFIVKSWDNYCLNFLYDTGVKSCLGNVDI